MGDFPPEWSWVRDLQEGGQGYTFVVRRADGSDSKSYVLKRLKNPKRAEQFEREIQACKTIDHPNVLRVLEQGLTPKGKPFLITEYCEGGSLEKHRPHFDNPRDGLGFFQQIVNGVASAHSNEPPIYHLDLKPENVVLKQGVPVVCDFGICHIEDDEVSLTREGPRGSMYFCAPELRNPKISGSPQPAAADVYSLGKILYWLFTGEVYDGHEEDYGNDPNRALAHLCPSNPQFTFIDDLISRTVTRNPTSRYPNAMDLKLGVSEVLDRIEAGGRVLDIRIPQRCLFCGVGLYRPAHAFIETPYGPPFPDANKRKNPPPQPLGQRIDIYEQMKNVSHQVLGTRLFNAAPLFLVCDYCGNVQYFRFDWTKDKHGENWRP